MSDGDLPHSAEPATAADRADGPNDQCGAHRGAGRQDRPSHRQGRRHHQGHTGQDQVHYLASLNCICINAY